jgi:DNA-binding transcriptional MerR regulator
MKNTSLTYNVMLTIDQISQITGIRKSTLRYWEKCFGASLKPARTHSNRREYSVEDLDRIKAIQRLLEQEHLTIHGVCLRLEELFSSPGKGEHGRAAKVKTVRKTPSPSVVGEDLGVH